MISDVVWNCRRTQFPFITLHSLFSWTLARLCELTVTPIRAFTRLNQYSVLDIRADERVVLVISRQRGTTENVPLSLFSFYWIYSMSQHLWQYCINRYMLLGAINSVASFSHYTHVPSTSVCIGLTFINGRACTRAFICSAAVSGVRLPVA